MYGNVENVVDRGKWGKTVKIAFISRDFTLHALSLEIMRLLKQDLETYVTFILGLSIY